MDAIQIVTPETIFPPRKRAFKPKTSTGCKTCRIRRIKCDEVRPACSQCTRGRRQCDGYASPGKDKSSRAVATRDLRPALRTTIVPPLAPKLFGSDTEIRYFEFFTNCTIPRLAGSFRSEFWQYSVLQATRHEPAIRHAMIAIAALHDGFLRSRGGHEDQAWQDDAYATKHYLKAIQHLTTPVGDDQQRQFTDVALMTCVLFVCFEVLRGFHGTALSHIDGGIRLFNQLQASTKSNSSQQYGSTAVFTQILAQLDKHATSVTTDRPRHLLTTPISPCEKTVPEPKVVCFLAKPFSSFDEARSALEKIQNASLRANSAIIDSALIFDYVSAQVLQRGLTQGHGYSALRMKQWMARFNELIQVRQANLTVDDLKRIELLKIMWVLMSINLQVDFNGVMKNETLWDGYFPEFVAIVEHAHRFMQLEDQQNRDLPVFTLEMEVLLPLYFVAAKCRDGAVRRRAIALLRLRERQEGLWNSSLTARVAERLMMIEEEGLSDREVIKMADITAARRVQGVEVEWSLERRRAKLLYKCFNIVSDGEQGIVELDGAVLAC